MPGSRRGMLRRHSQSKLMALIEHVIAVLWAVGTVLLLLGTAWCVVPIVLALGVLGLMAPGCWPALRLPLDTLRRRRAPAIETASGTL